MGRHPLLERQIRRHAPAGEAEATAWAPFLDAVDRAYRDAEADRRLVERAMEISSDELVRANAELHGIVQALPDVVLHLDHTGRVTHRGGTAGPMWAPAEIDGLLLADVCRAGAPDAAVAIASALTQRVASQFDHVHRLGRQILVHELRLAPLGEHGALVLVREVTVMRRAEQLRVDKEAAESANRAKSAFLANMSHELRTPLNAIIGYSEMLAEDADPATAKDLKQILGAGLHLLSIVNSLLDIARIEAGRLEVTCELIDLTQLVPDILASVRPLAEKNGNRLVSDLAPELQPFVSDTTKLQQILLNLIGNGCKFTYDGTIAVSVAPGSHHGSRGINFIVRDTGPGIAPEDLGRLFKDFSQIDDSNTRRHGGTGLGLAISRRLAGLLGGHVSVSSALGEGSVFTLWLPEVNDDANVGVDAGVLADAGRVS